LRVEHFSNFHDPILSPNLQHMVRPFISTGRSSLRTSVQARCGSHGCLKVPLQGKHVLVRTDNTATVAYIKLQGGLRSRCMWQLARPFLLWSQKHLRSHLGVQQHVGHATRYLDSIAFVKSQYPPVYSPRVARTTRNPLSVGLLLIPLLWTGYVCLLAPVELPAWRRLLSSSVTLSSQTLRSI